MLTHDWIKNGGQVISTAILALMAQFFRITMITPRFLVSFWLITSFLLVTSRIILRPVLASLRRRGRDLRHILVVGTNSRAIEFARSIQTRPELGYRLVGFSDDDWQGMSEFKQSGFSLVCDHAGLPDFLRCNVVDEIAIYLPGVRYVSYFKMLCRQKSCIEYAGDGVPLQSDYGHLTGAGSMLVATKLRESGVLN